MLGGGGGGGEEAGNPQDCRASNAKLSLDETNLLQDQNQIERNTIYRVSHLRYFGTSTKTRFISLILWEIFQYLLELEDACVSN